jgi:hypothetical protein
MPLSSSCLLFLAALALSVQCHFVELDPWVVTNVLQPNIDNCDFNSESVIHTQKVEAFFDRAEEPGGLLVCTALGSCDEGGRKRHGCDVCGNTERPRFRLMSDRWLASFSSDQIGHTCRCRCCRCVPLL